MVSSIRSQNLLHNGLQPDGVLQFTYITYYGMLLTMYDALRAKKTVVKVRRSSGRPEMSQ